MWQLVWPGYGVVKEWQGSESLHLTDLTYEHSGIYACFASNNIKCKTGETVMSGSLQIYVPSKMFIYIQLY